MAAKGESRNTTSGLVDSWQNDKSVTDCLKYSLDNDILSDVTFKVGVDQKTVKAHKLILSLRSSAFMPMLNGAMAAQDDIVIPDIEADIFEEFLQFVYTDQVHVDGNNVIGLLYAATKYDVNTLQQQCMRYLETSMTCENAPLVMEQAHLYEEHALKEEALKLICRNGDDALKSDDVVALCQKCLDDVIQSEELRVSEQTVFEAVLNWSHTACKNLGREATLENRRQVLGDVVMHLRYPLLPQDYFVHKVMPTQLLTEAEEYKIMNHLLSPDIDVSPFIATQRKASCMVNTCITRFDYKAIGWRCHKNRDDGIMFSINKNAALLGFQLYGIFDNTTQSYDVTAFLTNASTDDVMDGSSITTTVVTDTKTYDVLFPQPVHLKKDVQYNLIVNIKGPWTYRGVHGRSVVEHDNITCSFFNYEQSKHSNKISSGTCVNYGQIPSLLFYVYTADCYSTSHETKRLCAIM